MPIKAMTKPAAHRRCLSCRLTVGLGHTLNLILLLDGITAWQTSRKEKTIMHACANVS